jgi:hypothetical protein
VKVLVKSCPAYRAGRFENGVKAPKLSASGGRLLNAGDGWFDFDIKVQIGLKNLMGRNYKNCIRL